MSMFAVPEATTTHSLSWFSDARGGDPVPVSLAAYHALVGEPGGEELPLAELLGDAAVNAAGETWRAEALLTHLTPTLLADMTADPSDDTEVTRQVPLSASQSVKVTVHREPANEDDADAVWLFRELWVARF